MMCQPSRRDNGYWGRYPTQSHQVLFAECRPIKTSFRAGIAEPRVPEVDARNELVLPTAPLVALGIGLRAPTSAFGLTIERRVWKRPQEGIMTLVSDAEGEMSIALRCRWNRPDDSLERSHSGADIIESRAARWRSDDRYAGCRGGFEPGRASCSGRFQVETESPLPKAYRDWGLRMP